MGPSLPSFAQTRQRNSDRFQNSCMAQPKVEGPSLFLEPVPKDLDFQAREKQAVRSSVTKGDAGLCLASQDQKTRIHRKSTIRFLGCRFPVCGPFSSPHHLSKGVHSSREGIWQQTPAKHSQGIRKNHSGEWEDRDRN